MEKADIQKSITPLRLIFWGGIICILDFKINGFDIINDVIGTFMIAYGVFKLADIQVHNRYAAAMKYVKIISILCIFQAIVDNFNYNVPDILSILLLLFGLAKVIAIVVFCIAMGWFCEVASLVKSRQSWKITTILFTVIYLIPLGLFYLISILTMASGESFNIDLGPSALILLVVFCVPLIHLFISTSRMKNEALLSTNLSSPSEDMS